MRHTNALRRTVAVVSATALLAAGSATSLFVGVANAAGATQPLTVSPQFVGNTDATANRSQVTFTTTGTEFNPDPSKVTLTIKQVVPFAPDGSATPTTYQLTPIANSVAVPPQTTTSGPHYRSVTAAFNLQQIAPGAYDVTIDDVTPATPPATQPTTVTYACTGCLTISGFKPTVVALAKNTAQPGSTGPVFESR